MIAENLYRELKKNGVKFEQSAGKLSVKLPKTLAPDLKKALGANKDALKVYLQVLFNQSKAQHKVVSRKKANQWAPLSFAQSRLWFIDNLQGGTPEYNMPMAFNVSGLLDITLLERVFKTIIERHEILRTVYLNVQGEAQQQIKTMSDINFAITVVDMRHLMREIMAETVKAKVAADVVRAFDLTQDLMLRVSYLKTADDAGVLVFNMHHIASDGWSMEVLTKEFFTLYDSFSQGKVNPLPALEIQYADYAHRQREYIAGDVLAEQLSYWAKQLEDTPVVHSLPLSFKRPAVKAHLGAVLSGNLPAAVGQQLQALAKRHQLTPFMLLHGALSLLLSRHSNSSDIVIGTPIANRLQAELAPLIGFFVNTLVLRVDTNQACLAAYFKHIRQIHLDAQSRQDVPFEQLVDKLKVPRSSAHGPLFQIMMTTNTDYGVSHASKAVNLSGVKVQPYQSDAVQTKFDLNIDLSINDEGVSLSWTYDVSLFSEPTIARFNDHLCRLLTALSEVTDVEQAPYSLAMLSEAETQYLTAELNDITVDYPKDKCIHELFEAQAQIYPDKIALVFADKQMSYQELNEQSNQLAHYLRSHHHIIPDTLVGLCVERSLEMVIGILAILKAGGAYVPLDPSYPQERLEYMIKDAALDVVLSHTVVQGALRAFTGTILNLDGMGNIEKGPHAFYTYPKTNIDKEEQGLTSSHLAYVIYTSGSTGKPKGVMLEHANVTRLFFATDDEFKFNSSDCWCLFHSISFDFSVWELWGGLIYGGKLVIISSQVTQDPYQLVQTLNEQNLTVLNQTPSSFKNLLDYILSEGLDIPSLRYVVFGGEALQSSHVKRWFLEYGKSNLSRLINMYGITETTVHLTYGVVDESSFNEIHIGKTLKDQSIIILDKHQSMVPKGINGEAYVGGNGLARGYLNRPELTAERFIENPFYDAHNSHSSKRLYRSGDLVRYLPNGNLEFIGRADDQVKIRGYRIELGEVETQLTEVKLVDSALVIVKDVAGSQQLVGYIKPQTNLAVDRQDNFIVDVKVQLAKQLPDYMVPSLLVLVHEWPLTPNGKIDRKALPAPDGSVLQGAYVKPQTATENTIAEIWSTLLGIDVNKISARANFFELGGHSLLTIRLLSEVRKHLKAELSVKTVFDSHTLKALAAEVDKNDNSQVFAAPVASNKGACEIHAMSFAQQRLWFIDNIQGGTPEYNMPMAFNVSGLLDITLLERVFNTIIDRHEILRTVYLDVQGEAQQQIKTMSDINFAIAIVELRHLMPEIMAETVKAKVAADVVRAFDLTQDLMVRVSYLKTADDAGVLVFNMHHIASDGWSMEVLTKEFFTLYDSFSQGKVSPLPALEIQYADYAHWQKTYIAGEVLAGQLAYWTSQLADIPVVHSLPLSYKRPAVKAHLGAVLSGNLSAAVGQQLQALAKRHQLTPFMLLHGALSLLLSRHSNSSDIVIGTPIANRLQAELTPLIGFFVNTLVLRVDTNQTCLAAYFKHIRQIHLDAQSRQDVPFEQLVDKLKVPRSSAHGPLFQIMMTTNTDYGVNHASKAVNLSGVKVQPYQSDAVQAKFDLDVGLHISDTGVGIHWTYDISLFSEQAISQLNERLCKLLTGLSEVTDYAIAPHNLPMLSETERQHLIYEVNDTAKDYPKDKCIHQLFEAQAQINPDNIALVFADKQLTYQELNEQSNQLAHYLTAHHHIKPDTLVGLCVERSLEMVIGILAILKAGGAYVPLDPSYPKVRLDYMIEDAALDLILSQGAGTDSLKGFSGQIVALDNRESFVNYSKTTLDKLIVGASPSNLAYVIYTSGSTGKPKGVMIEHKSLVNYQLHTKSAYEITAKDNILQFSNICFDIFVEEFFGALCHGATLVLSNANCRDSLPSFVHFCDLYDVSIVSLPTAFWADLVSDKSNYKRTSIRVVIVGGEALTVSTVHEHYESFGEQVQLINTYGPTESTITATMYQTSVADKRELSIPIGYANTNNQLFVLGEHDNIVPIGSIGELYIGGEGLARGYLNRPKLTAQCFIANPFYDANNSHSSRRLYRTGDLVRYLAHGNLEFIGRADDQVKIRGFRIELGEIETQLTQVELVDSAIVIASEVAGSQQLVGYIKPQKNLAVGEKNNIITDVKVQLAKQLPDYMVPKLLVLVAEWPLTPNGKVDKKSLPTPIDSVLQGEYIAPANKTEKNIAKIWAQLLSVNEFKISADANFFELGGNSLLIARVSAEIAKKFPQYRTVSIRDLYLSQTIRQQAALLDDCVIEQKDEHRIVTLNKSEIAKASIYFIPGVAALTHQFMPLAKALTPHFQVKAFNYKGLLDNEQPDLTIQDTADDFANLIVAQGSKNVVIAGHSFGGIIALEVIKRLQKKAIKCHLVLLDTYFHNENSHGVVDKRELLSSVESVELDKIREKVLALANIQTQLLADYQLSRVDELCPSIFLATQQGKVGKDYPRWLLENFNKVEKIHWLEGNHFSILHEQADAIASIIQATINPSD